MQLGAEVVIFDPDLSPGQARAISEATEPGGGSTYHADPRHLRAARDEPRRQAAGRARAAPLRAAAAGREEHDDVAADRRHRRTRPGRDQARDQSPPRTRSDPIARAAARGARRRPPAAPQAARAPRAAGDRDLRLHQRGQVDAAQRADRRRRGRRRQAVRDARSDQPALAVSARARGDHHRHRRVHPRPARGAGRRVSRDARGDVRRRSADPRRRRLDPDRRPPIRAVEGIPGRSRPALPRLLVWNKADRSRARRRGASRASRRWLRHLGARPRNARRCCSASSASYGRTGSTRQWCTNSIWGVLRALRCRP